MGRPQGNSKVKRHKSVTRRYAGHKRTKDLDQIHTDLKPENIVKLVNQEDGDLPGLGKNYCIACARHFISQAHLEAHFKSKPHKKRIKALKDTPYTDLEAQLAAGKAPPDNGNNKPSILPEPSSLPVTLDPSELRKESV
ncbi:hypothetical protein P9112_011149 [Eukaryota sp. TZLM1-RC]